jgi:hypothetical protein
LQPMAFRSCVLRQILPAVPFSFLAIGFSRTECPSGSGDISRRICRQFQFTHSRSHLFP